LDLQLSKGIAKAKATAKSKAKVKVAGKGKVFTQLAQRLFDF